MRSKLIPNGRFRPGSFYFVYVGILTVIASIIFAYFYQMYFNSVVEFRLEQLESQNIAYEVEIEPYNEVIEEVAQTYPITEYTRHLIESTVMAEAGGEGLEGMEAVAQVILCRAVLWQMTPVEVVRQEGQFATYEGEISEECRLAVSNVFDLGVKPFSANVTHFFSGEVKPYWAENKEEVGSRGNHRFWL